MIRQFFGVVCVVGEIFQLQVKRTSVGSLTITMKFPLNCVQLLKFWHLKLLYKSSVRARYCPFLSIPLTWPIVFCERPQHVKNVSFLFTNDVALLSDFYTTIPHSPRCVTILGHVLLVLSKNLKWLRLEIDSFQNSELSGLLTISGGRKGDMSYIWPFCVHREI